MPEMNQAEIESQIAKSIIDQKAIFASKKELIQKLQVEIEKAAYVKEKWQVNVAVERIMEKVKLLRNQQYLRSGGAELNNRWNLFNWLFWPAFIVRASLDRLPEKSNIAYIAILSIPISAI